MRGLLWCLAVAWVAAISTLLRNLLGEWIVLLLLSRCILLAKSAVLPVALCGLRAWLRLRGSSARGLLGERLLLSGCGKAGRWLGCDGRFLRWSNFWCCSCLLLTWDRREGSPWLGYRRVLWWLSACFEFFAILIDVITAETKAAELHSSLAYRCTVIWQEDRLLLLCHSSCEACGPRTTCRCLVCRSLEAAHLRATNWSLCWRLTCN